MTRRPAPEGTEHHDDATNVKTMVPETTNIVLADVVLPHGLSAAYELHEPGCSVMQLEATCRRQDRIAGDLPADNCCARQLVDEVAR